MNTFEPANTKDMIYIPADVAVSLDEIIQAAQTQWGASIDMSRIRVTAEHIQTKCLGYDLYDSGDYTNYLCLELDTNIES